MNKDIEAKTLLTSSTRPDSLFGIKYTMNLYRGCQHQCIYCDSRSECYRIENFADILVKANAIELLDRELSSKRIKGTIGTGSMNDPYMPLEACLGMTRRALTVIAAHHFPVHIITKGDIVLRDVDLLQEISRDYAAVSLTITSADDGLARKLEPGAPVSSARFAALKALSAAGIYAGITLMPVLPFIEDNPENILSILERARDSGAHYILAWFGVSMRDRQRSYYYRQLDRLFPGLRAQYERRYGEHYECAAPTADSLYCLFQERCDQYGITTHMQTFAPVRIGVQSGPQQLELFD